MDEAGAEERGKERDAHAPTAKEPLWLKQSLSPSEARAALVVYRDTVIAPAIENWEPERSILRSDMIEIFIDQRITEDRDWFAKLPLYLRRNTNGFEKRRFFEEICNIVASG